MLVKNKKWFTEECTECGTSFSLEICVTAKKQFIVFDKVFFLFNTLVYVFLNIMYYLVMKCSSNRKWLEICFIVQNYYSLSLFLCLLFSVTLSPVKVKGIKQLEIHDYCNF